MNRVLKTTLSLLLITALVAPLAMVPRPAKAVPAIVGTLMGTCVGAGLLANTLQRLIPSIGGQSEVPVNEGALRKKEENLDVAARCIARQLFDGSITGMLGIVRTGGRDGAAAYVKDWRNFQANAEYRGEDIFRAILSNTQLCNYMGQGIKNLFGVTSRRTIPPNTQTRIGNLDPYQLRASCTMPSNFSITNYQRDFAGNGGWDAWSRMLEPQNNYYGALLMAQDEVAKQRNLESSADTNEAISGQGYTAKREACKTTGNVPRCTVLGTVLTPGSTLSDAVNTTFQSELNWLANSDELNEVIASLIERFVNRLLNIEAPDSDQTYSADPTIPPTPPPTGGTCPAPTTSATLCASVDQNTVLGILNGYPPTNAGITEAIVEVQGVYPNAYVVPHDTGTMALDIIDFGGGMRVDVMINAGATDASWGWIEICPCGGGGGGVPPPAPPAPVCINNQTTKTQLTTILNQTNTVMGLINIDFFEDVLGPNRKGELMIISAINGFQARYVDLYNIEKTLTAPNQQELKSMVLTWEAMLQGFFEALPVMIWNSQAEKVVIDRQLTTMKNSAQVAVDELTPIPICSASPSPSLTP